MLTLTNEQNTHLDRTQVSLCVSMIENGVNPDALAVSFNWLRAYRRPGKVEDGTSTEGGQNGKKEMCEEWMLICVM